MTREPVFEVRDHVSPSQVDDLLRLYGSEWWSSERTRADVERMLLGSDLLCAIVERESDSLAAFARVLTDRVYTALVLDVIVGPAVSRPWPRSTPGRAHLRGAGVARCRQHRARLPARAHAVLPEVGLLGTGRALATHAAHEQPASLRRRRATGRRATGRRATGRPQRARAAANGRLRLSDRSTKPRVRCFTTYRQPSPTAWRIWRASTPVTVSTGRPYSSAFVRFRPRPAGSSLSWRPAHRPGDTSRSARAPGTRRCGLPWRAGWWAANSRPSRSSTRKPPWPGRRSR